MYRLFHTGNNSILAIFHLAIEILKREELKGASVVLSGLCKITLTSY